MKKLLLALAIVPALCGSLRAQTGMTGSWRVEDGADSWTATLKTDGEKLTGTVTSCASNRGVIEIFEAEVDGNAFRFKCKSLNGQRTLTFTGMFKGDEIQLAWEGEGTGFNDTDVFFGPKSPKQFTAKRLNVITWTGTFQNINGAGVVAPGKNVASLEIKKVTDPHWRWRDAGDVTVMTFVAQGSYELRSFVRTDQQLSFSFDRIIEDEPSSKDARVDCVLPRRADGAYEGNCSANFRRHVILTPPESAAAAK